MATIFSLTIIISLYIIWPPPPCWNICCIIWPLSHLIRWPPYMCLTCMYAVMIILPHTLCPYIVTRIMFSPCWSWQPLSDPSQNDQLSPSVAKSPAQDQFSSEKHVLCCWAGLTACCRYVYRHVVLRSRNYLFSTPAPAPALFLISAPAPALCCHLN